MPTALTTELGPSCSTGALPLAALELFESPDPTPESRAVQPGIQTTLHVLDGVVYVATEDEEWVLTPGDTATIRGDSPYRRWNAGEDQARWIEVDCAAIAKAD